MNQIISFVFAFLSAYEAVAFYLYCAGMLVFAFQVGYMYSGRFSATHISNSVAATFYRLPLARLITLVSTFAQALALLVFYQLGFDRLAACMTVGLVMGALYHLAFVPYIVRCREIAATWGHVTA